MPLDLMFEKGKKITGKVRQHHDFPEFLRVV